MTNKLSRRSLLTAAPAGLLPLAVQATPVASEADPIVPLYREWLSARAEWSRLATMPGNENWDWPEARDAEAREDAAFDAMARLTPTSLEGMAALTYMIWDNSGPSAFTTSPEYPRQCDYPEVRMIAALWRAATGETGLPRPL